MFQKNQNICSAQKALTFLSAFAYPVSSARNVSLSSDWLPGGVQIIISHRNFLVLTTFVWPLLCKAELDGPCLSSYIPWYKDIIGLYRLDCNYFLLGSLSQIDVLFLEDRDFIFVSVPQGLVRWLLQQIPSNSGTHGLGVTVSNQWCWVWWLLLWTTKLCKTVWLSEL